MRSASQIAVTSAVLLLLGSGGPPTFACGFDGLLGDGFSATHPKSIPVAFAIADVVTAGIVDKVAVAPIVPGSAGYWRAVGRLSTFQRLLSAENPSGAQPANISLLFIDSQLWARFSSGPQGYDLQVHTSGPSPNDVVIVTIETILAGVIDGTMQAQKALDVGLIAIDGKEDQVEMMRSIMVTATDRTHIGIVAGSFATPIRFFGPLRQAPSSEK